MSNDNDSLKLEILVKNSTILFINNIIISIAILTHTKYIFINILFIEHKNHDNVAFLLGH